VEQKHRHIATYVCDTNPARTAQYPFAEGQTPPRHIKKDGETFTLRVCVYDVDETAPKRAAA
jgi:hypothetical protein